MKKSWLVRALCLILLTLVLNGAVTLAAEVGSEGDPLVTLSYLNEGYLKTVTDKIDAAIAERNTSVTKEIDRKISKAGGGDADVAAGASFTLVTLGQGQTLLLDLGSEVLLRVGTANCVAASAPGLIDITAAGSINNGAGLEKNHLYMATIEERGVLATAETVKVLVRGGYVVL